MCISSYVSGDCFPLCCGFIQTQNIISSSIGNGSPVKRKLPLLQLVPAAKPVTVPKMVKLASLTSLTAPLDTRIKAVVVLAPEGTVHVRRLVVAPKTLLSTTQLAPLSKEYSTVCVPVIPLLFQVIVSLVPGLSFSFPLG